MNLFSHSNESITIYAKNAYIEDGGSKYINMSSVTITSHPDVISLNEVSLLVPTSISQPGIFKKALFSLVYFQNDSDLLQQYSLKFGETIMTGTFTDYEMFLFSQTTVSIIVGRSSFTLENVDIYREETIPNPNQVFLSPVYIHENLLKICKFDYLSLLLSFFII